MSEQQIVEIEEQDATPETEARQRARRRLFTETAFVSIYLAGYGGSQFSDFLEADGRDKLWDGFFIFVAIPVTALLLWRAVILAGKHLK